MANAERIAALEAELATLKGERRKEIVALLASKTAQIKALIAECVQLSDEGKVAFTITIGDGYDSTHTYDPNLNAFSGWDSSSC